MRRTLVFLCSFALLVPASVPAEDTPDLSAQLRQQQEAVEKLTVENGLLQARLASLETCTLGRDDLVRRYVARLQGIAKDVKPQRQAMADFESYIKWMSGSLSSYSRYVEAGSAAAALARFLPIPYAGQAGAFAKFVAHFALTLNATSNAVEKYLATSQQFIGRVEALETAPPLTTKELTELGRYGDEQLLKDMVDVRGKLTSTSELSSSALAFLEGMAQYLAGTDEYWNKTKQFITRKDADPKEKSYLTESVTGLKTQAASFNTRLKLFDDATLRSTPLIKSLGAYDELLRELDAKAAPPAP